VTRIQFITSEAAGTQPPVVHIVQNVRVQTIFTFNISLHIPNTPGPLYKMYLCKLAKLFCINKFCTIVTVCGCYAMQNLHVCTIAHKRTSHIRSVHCTVHTVHCAMHTVAGCRSSGALAMCRSSGAVAMVL